MKTKWMVAGLMFFMMSNSMVLSDTAEVAKRTTVQRKAVILENIEPAVVVERGPGHWFIDFGKAWFGRPELVGVPESEAGKTITVHMGEMLAGPQQLNREPPKGSCIRYWKSDVELKAGGKPQNVRMWGGDNRLMTKETGVAMPFRYVEIEGAPWFKKENIRMVAISYPYSKDAASFKCSDERINAVWELCRHTIQATSFGGVFVDGDRERLPYEADAYINQLGWYYCTDDIGLARYSHEYLILNPTWPTEWILFSVLMAWEDYWHTGDTVSLQAFYEDLKGKVLMGLRREDGLISTVQPPVTPEIMAAAHYTKKKPLTDIVDWPHCENDNYAKGPFNTVVNAFHILAARRMGEIAEVLGKGDDAKLFSEAAAKSLESFNSKLVNPATGIYLDGEGGKHSALHANMFPMAFGLVPEERKAKVIEFIKSRGMACSVYGAQFLMESLFEGNEVEHALALMTADGDRSWTHMIERVGSTMCLEAWDIKYKTNLDWNHAWGAAPANILPRKVLGVEPAAPGFSKIRIRPRLGNLSFAEGKVPTVKGPVQIRIDQGEKTFALRFEIPANITAQVVVPKRPGKLLLDGKDAQAQEKGMEMVLENVPAGKHEIKYEGGG